MPWSVHALVQAIILGVLTGGVYALMASGQTLIFGIMKVINLAQAAFVVLAAYLTYSLFTLTGMDPFLSILITTPLPVRPRGRDPVDASAGPPPG